MKKLLTLGLLVSLLTACSPSSTDNVPSNTISAPPNLEEIDLFRPVFNTSKGEIAAGTAFLANHRQRNYFITAQHLIGEAGGLDRDYTGAELDGFLHSVDGEPVREIADMITSKNLMIIPEAEAVTNESGKNDVLIFRVEENPNIVPLKLSNSIPSVGDTVWLYAELANSDNLLHRAEVIESDRNFLTLSYQDTALNLRASSGAPIINAQKEVVGINLAGGLQSGELIGWANPGSSIIAKLERHAK